MEDQPEVIRKRATLTRCYERRKFAAETFLEHQRTNHKTLYDFEVREAAALYEKGAEQIKTQLKSALLRKRKHCVLARERVAAAIEKGGTGGSEVEVRNDLREIVKSLREAAAEFKKNEKSIDAKLVWADGVRLECDDASFGVGDSVSVFSRPLNSEFIATIQAMNSAEIRLLPSHSEPDDPTLVTVKLSQLRTGRLILMHV